jgi:hypothetical protein
VERRLDEEQVLPDELQLSVGHLLLQLGHQRRLEGLLRINLTKTVSARVNYKLYVWLSVSLNSRFLSNHVIKLCL